MDNYLSDKTVLLTGAAGFLGSHLVDSLLESDAKVIGVDNLITGRVTNLDQALKNSNFTFIEANASQTPHDYLPENTKIDLVLHFASPASPPRYQKFPVETYLVNSMGTHNLLQYLLETNNQARFVYASTSEIYGDPKVHPQTEDYWGNVNPNGVRSCYDESKRLGESICGVHARNFEMDVRIVRIFNTYGPRIDPDDGRVIPNFIKQALADEPLAIYGDGTQTRSYCYVDDLVDVILKYASAEGLIRETINIGNPEEHTVKETAEIVAKVVGIKPKYETKPLPKDDPTRRQPDISKAKKLLGWEPKVSFEEGLKRTVESFRN